MYICYVCTDCGHMWYDDNDIYGDEDGLSLCPACGSPQVIEDNDEDEF